MSNLTNKKKNITLLIIVASLGYFVDIYDLILFNIIKKESLEELSIADFDALVEKTKEIQKALFPSLSDTPENEANPKAIIANSNG